MTTLVFMQAFAIFAAAFGDYGVQSSQSWTRTTENLFSLRLRGEGLTAFDTLRLIPSGFSCNDDSGDVKSYDATILWNCPNIGTGCARIRGIASVDIPVQTYQWNCTTIDTANSCSGNSGIMSITVDTSGIVTLVFSSSPSLVGDELIRIGSGVSCGPNCDSTKLNLLLGGSADASSDAFKIGNRIYLNTSDPANTFRMNISLLASATPPELIIDPSQGFAEWFRTDIAQTRLELKGMVERTGINVCWNGGGLPNGYTSSAGTLDVLDGGIMSAVSIEPVSTSPDPGPVPLIVNFSTSGSSKYLNASAVTGLVISIPQPAVLSLRTLDDLALSPSSLPSQTTCSSIFSEMSSSDTFPLPSGCLVTRWDVSGSPVAFDITVLFERGNGLAPSRDYQFVVNALIDAATLNTDACCATQTCGSSTDALELRGCQYLTLRTLGNVEETPFEAIDIGRPLLKENRRPRSFTRTVSDPFLSSALLENGINGLVSFTAGDRLNISLQAGDGISTGIIQGGQLVRIAFPPFLDFQMGGAVCQASVLEYPSAAVSCTSNGSYAIVVGLSDDVPVISGASKITISIGGLSPPTKGFFPISPLIELLDSSGEKPFAIRADSSVLLYALPVGSSDPLAQIVAEPGITDFSFQGHTAREINIKILSKISVQINTILDITLPQGFVCNSASFISGNETFWSEVLNSPNPSGRGVLATTWTSYNNATCRLTTTSTLFGMSSVFVNLNVDYPSSAVRVSDSIFNISFEGFGVRIEVPFRAEDSGFVRSLAVQGRLTNTHIEPLISWTQTVQGGVGVFFKTQQTVSSGGVLRVHVPGSVSACTASNLQKYVYGTIARIPGLGACSVKSPRVVEIAFSGTLAASTRYALELTLSGADEGDWRVQTVDNGGFLVDGSDSQTVPMIEGLTDSLVIYDSVDLLNISIPDFTPRTRIPVSFGFDICEKPGEICLGMDPVNIRLSVPVGITLHADGVVSVLGDVDWSINASAIVGVPHTITFNNIQLSNGTEYSFSVELTFPDRPPAESLNAFRLEVGYDLPSPRPFVLEKVFDEELPVLGMHNVEIFSVNKIAGEETLLRFRFDLHGPTGEVTIGVPTGYSFPTVCSLLIDDQADYSVGDISQAVCAFNNTASEIIITHSLTAGKYSFVIRGENPSVPTVLFVDHTQPCDFSQCFTVSSPTELAMTMPGFSITTTAYAGFVKRIGLTRTWFEGRNDRPGKRNSFILYLAPVEANSDTITIQAPPGFELDPNCLSPIFTVDATKVFGPNIPWPPGHTLWPSHLLMVSCVGDGNKAIAKFSGIIPTVSVDTPFAIRVGVASNPTAASAVFSQWSVIFGDSESSAPFETFPLWTFQDGSSLVSSVRGRNASSLVTLSFVPFTNISDFDGWINVEAPAGYSLDSPWLPLPVGGLRSGQEYAIEFRVRNPVSGSGNGRWLVTTGSMSSMQGDETYFETPALVDSLASLDISGVQTEGQVVIPDLGFYFAFTADLHAGDVISVTGPMEYTFHSDDSDIGVSGAEITLIVNQTVVSGTVLSVKVTTVNPASTPAAGNEFVVSLSRSGALIAQSGTPGWEIVPRLEDVSISLTGTRKASGSVSSIQAVFNSSTAAFDFAEIMFISPLDFSSVSSVEITVLDTRNVTQTLVPAVVDKASIAKGIRIGLTSVVEPGSLVTVTVDSVYMGLLPGPVIAHILVYEGSQLVGSRVRYPAFELPSKLTVESATIVTQSVFNAKNIFGPSSEISDRFLVPRTGETANITFKYFVALGVPAGANLTFRHPHFTMNSSEIVLPQGLVAEQTTAVTFQALIPSSADQAMSNFSLSVLNRTDSSGLPEATNDNETMGFLVGEKILFSLAAVSSPPRAMVTVSLDVAASGSFTLIAPEGFSFPDDCMATPVPGVTCTDGEVFDGTRNSADLIFSDQIPGINILVVTPGSDPDNNVWLLASATGWGVLEAPITVQAMTGVAIDFTALAGIRTPVTVGFSNLGKLRKNSKLRLFHPPQYIFDCTSWKRGTLPVYPEASWSDVCALSADGNTSSTIVSSQTFLDIIFFEDLVPGNYSFSVKATMPTSAPAGGSFSLALIDSEGAVVDSLLNYSAPSLRVPSDPLFLSVTVPGNDYAALKWYPSTAAGDTRMGVELTFVLNQQIGISGDGLVPLSAILITFPETFVNRTEMESDVVQTGDKDAIIDSIDYTHQGCVVINLKRESAIPAGTYGFRFPVWVPSQIAPYNVWKLSFCFGNTTCQDPSDAAVAATLPYPGFLIGESNPLTLAMITSSAEKTIVSSFLAAIFAIGLMV